MNPWTDAMNPWTDAFVADMLDRSAFRWPDREAVVDDDVRLTFAELIERRDALAGALHERGVRQGCVVATYLGEGWEHVVLLYTLLYLGVRVVPLNLTWEERELRYALGHAEVEHLVAATTYRGNPLWGKLDGVPLGEEVVVPDLPALRSVIGFDPAGPLDLPLSLSALLEERAPRPPRGALQTGYLMFTSGSTAFPKGALIRQDAALGTSFHVGERLGLDETDQLLNVLPLYHCGGLITALLGCHQRGVTVHLFEGVDVEQMVDALDREQCTVMIGFDIVNLRILRALQARGRPVPVRKIQVTGGAAYDELTPLGIHAVICYALTESSNFVSTTVRDEDEHGRHSNGYPFPGVEVRIGNPETGEWLPRGEPGEICFRGWNLMAGYHRDAERTRAAFDHEGFLHTGDYGWLDGDGRVYYRGRFAMMIKSGGENVSEIEVEGFLTSQVPDVVNAAVVGVPDEQWGEIVVAFVETTGPFDAEAVRDACRGGLAKYKIPKRVFSVGAGEWPVTQTGKLKKDDLRAQARDLAGVSE